MKREKCKQCGKRIRGARHEEGMHHKGISVPKKKRGAK